MTAEVTSPNDNVLDVSIYHAGIKTLEELLEIANIDLEVWEPVKFMPNAWPTTMKGEDGNPISVINHQAKAILIRKEPVEIIPVVQPVSVRAGFVSDNPPKRPVKDFSTAVFLPDPQFGFLRNIETGKMTPTHDRKALDVALKLVKDIGPSHIIWLGDIMDLPMESKYPKKPEYYFTLQSSVIEAAWWIRQFKKVAPRAEHVVFEGNHDKRLEDSQRERNISAYGLKAADQIHLAPAHSVPRLLGLDTLGIEYIGNYPDGQYKVAPNVIAEHGAVVRPTSGSTAAAMLNKRNHSSVFGHVHRAELAWKTDWFMNKRTEIFAMSCGCLCDVKGNTPGTKRKQNWQQAIGIVNYGSSFIEPSLIRITNGRAFYHGIGLYGESRKKEIIRDTKWEML